MKALLRVALAVALCPAPAFADALEDAVRKAYESARELSQASQYGEAAAVLARVRDEYTPKLNVDKAYKLGDIKRAIGVYEQRAAWATAAEKDPKAGRALLVSLLDERSPVDMAAPADKRVAALLISLRSLDPKAKAMFAPRKVKVVVVEGPALLEAEARALAENVVGPLRDLGFIAGTKEGDELLTLTVTPGKEIGDIGGMFGGGKELNTMISCELKVDAAWTAGAASVVRIDLSRRGSGFSDIPRNCETNRLREIPPLVAPRLVKAWDAQALP